MTTPSQDLMKREGETARTPRRHHHHTHRVRRIAARVLLVLGLLLGVSAISHFAYIAVMKSDCYHRGPSDALGLPTPGEPKSDECRVEIVRLDEIQRVDASVAVLAVAMLLGSVAMFLRLRKHRR